MGKELFGDFGRRQSTACQAALKGCQWQSLGEPLNYFKLLCSPVGLWSLLFFFFLPLVTSRRQVAYHRLQQSAA